MRVVNPLILVVLVACFGGCATVTHPVAVGSGNDAALLQLGKQAERVFLLSPQMTFETVGTEAPLSPEANGGPAASGLITSVAGTRLTEMGFQVVTLDGLPADSLPRASAAVQRLTEEYKVLSSSYKDKSALLAPLSELSGASGARFVFVPTLRVKVGSGATYDPNSGAMAQGTNSSALKAVLVSVADGKIVWGNESLLRYLPSHGKFEQAVHMLFPTQPK